MRRARQGAVAAAIVCVALAVGASPAAALTQGQANVLAVRKLDPQQWAGNVVLFGLPAPVPGGRTVTAWSLWPGRHAMPAVRLKDSNWLYWEDFAYEGEFAHPSELLLINNRTGATREMFLDMVPLVNGRRTAFDSGELGYRSSSDMLYTSIAPPPLSPSGGFETPLAAVWPGGRTVAAATSRQGTAAQSRPITKKDLAKDCLITIGDRGPQAPGNSLGDPDTPKSLDAMDAWGKHAGLSVRDAPSSMSGLQDTVYQEIGAGCEDVMIYIIGHGVPPPASELGGKKIHYGRFAPPEPNAAATGPPAVVVQSAPAPETGGFGGGTVDTTVLTPDAVGDMIKKFADGDRITVHGEVREVKKNPKLRFKLKLDTCFAGRWATALIERVGLDPNSKEPNPVAFIEASSSGSEISFKHLTAGTEIRNGQPVTVYNEAANPNEITEFTNGNIQGLDHWLTNPAGGTTLVDGLKQAFTDGVLGGSNGSNGGDAARYFGYTHPQATGPGFTLGTPDGVTNYITIKSASSGLGTSTPAPPQPSTSTTTSTTTTATATGAQDTVGSTLDDDAGTAEQDAVDTVYFEDDGASPADAARAATISGDTVPVNGQVLSVTVKGMALLPATNAPIHFQDLRPQPNGSLTVIDTSQAFALPASGSPDQETTFQPTNMCVQAGDFVGLATEGGSTPFQIFAAPATGSNVGQHSANNGDMNGSNFTATPIPNTQLLMQETIGTGDQATALCPGGTGS